MISQARMDALFVVEAIDVTGDGSVEFGIASEAASVGEFGLQGMEEAFHVGVILAIARAVHAGHKAARAQEVLIAVGSTQYRGRSERAARAWDREVRLPFSEHAGS